MSSPSDWTLVEANGHGGPNFLQYNGEELLGCQCGYTCKIEFPQLQFFRQGTLYITNFKLCFFFFEETTRTFYVSQEGDYAPIYVPIHCVGVVSFSSYSYWTGESANTTQLEIVTKDFRFMKFIFDDATTATEVSDTVKNRAFWKTKNLPREESVFAFLHGPIPSENSSAFYDPEKEFFRQNALPGDDFVLSNLNEDYTLCPTYPRKILCPALLHEEWIRDSASFRSGSRFPAVCWVHPVTKVTLSRCSQPLGGMSNLFGHKSQSDEPMVTSLYMPARRKRERSFQLNSPSSASLNLASVTPIDDTKSELCIIDARSKLAAVCNSMKGGGHERTELYRSCTIRFMDIDNIHSMRTSFQLLMRACCLSLSPSAINSASSNTAVSPVPQSLVPDRATIDATGWLNHLKLVLEGALCTAKLIEDEICVLVHCSDGWDRTTQIVSLVQMFLDPFFRTIRGFGILIQKEWLSFGFKFEQRLGVGETLDYSNHEQSPIFLQFIDAVYQVLHQYPNWFEFNESYLITLLDQVNSGLFGDFLFNFDKERDHLRETTASVWSWLLHQENIALFKNSDFVHYEKPVFPKTATSHLVVWSGYYLRYNISMKQHHQHALQALQQKEATHKLIRENEKLKEKLEQDRNTIALYQQLFVEHLQGKNFREKIEHQINSNNTKPIQVVVEKDLNNGEILFRIRPSQDNIDSFTTINISEDDKEYSEKREISYEKDAKRLLIEDTHKPVVHLYVNNLLGNVLDNYQNHYEQSTPLNMPTTTTTITTTTTMTTSTTITTPTTPASSEHNATSGNSCVSSATNFTNSDTEEDGFETVGNHNIHLYVTNNENKHTHDNITAVPKKNTLGRVAQLCTFYFDIKQVMEFLHLYQK